MSAAQPIISVIIPIYNTRDYLPRCLTSILKNTYQNLEILCIDDGSTDGSAEVLDEFAQSDARLKIIHKANEGISATRNLGLNLASGEYVAFIDSDDWIHQEYFDTLMYFTLKYDANVAVCREIITATSLQDAPINIDVIQAHRLSLAQSVADYSAKRRIWGRIYSKEVLKGHFFCQEITYAEDTVFNLEVICNASPLRLVMVECPLYYYFVRYNSTVHTTEAIALKPAIEWYLSHIHGETTSEVKSIYIFEAFKGALSYRYGVMFEPNRKILQGISHKLISSCLHEMAELKHIPILRRMQYRILAMFPFLYRAFRIMDDKTMLVWEREKKQKLKRIKEAT